VAVNPHIARLPYPADALGHVEIDAPDTLEAGSMATIRVRYTAGRFGIDDQGSIRFLFRFASDAGRPQFERPGAPNFATVSASNGTTLLPEYHPRGAFRPWFKAIRVNVMRDALREGDSIELVLGDRSQGGSGWRAPTMRETGFEIRVQADPFGTVVYGDVVGGRTIPVVAGAPAVWRAVLPTLRSVGEPFELAIRADDRCGNPTPIAGGRLRLEPIGPLAGLPTEIEMRPGAALRVGPLTASAPGVIGIRVFDAEGQLLAQTNPMLAESTLADRHWWGDFHAQSEETVGTNSARDYFSFARDWAFCDFVGHQGNDFQISGAFWRELNALYREFHAPGRFVTIPGYEYSPVTHLGGDRNIFFLDEDRPIRRSSHALVEDLSDIDSDCNHVQDLFAAFKREGEEVLAFAHVGGRYADLRAGHDGDIERSVEIHSSWGTFEWLLFDAFELGHRVGIVSNSDDHKGRPGASHPGASIFGAYGGLTCLSLPELSRAAIWDCLKSRRHYGTTGDRLYLDVRAHLEGEAVRYAEDPKLKPEVQSTSVREAQMGDIVRVDADRARIAIRVHAGSPIERIDLRCGARTIETIRPFAREEAGSGHRIRIVWEGAEYRGRGRMTTWDGRLSVTGNEILSFSPINFWHLEKALRRSGPNELSWESVTTGNFAGAELVLAEPMTGTIAIDTPHVRESIALSTLGCEDTVLNAGGLERRVRLFRLPDANLHSDFTLDRTVAIAEDGDTPVYVRVTLENGHQAWSSPIYFFRR
jgi:hypothetical protein